jgi:hypothetical protein
MRLFTICDRRIRFDILNETSDLDPLVSLRQQNLNFANNYLEYLGKNKAMREAALARESGP